MLIIIWLVGIGDHLRWHPSAKLVVQELHLFLTKMKFLHLILHAIGRLLLDLLWLLLHDLLLWRLFLYNWGYRCTLWAWNEGLKLLSSLLKLKLLRLGKLTICILEDILQILT